MAADLALVAITSGAFAAIAAVCATRAIECWGGLAGGILSTLPTTIVPAALGLATRLSGQDLVAALFTVPLGMLFDGIFLLEWRYLPARLPAAWSPHGTLAVLVAVSLGTWLALAASSTLFSTLVLAGSGAGWTMAYGGVAFGVQLACGVGACVRAVPAPGGSQAVSWAALAARGGAAFAAIAAAVALSAVGGPLGGIAAAFPAMFLTSMVSLWLSQVWKGASRSRWSPPPPTTTLLREQGRDVPTGAAGPMMLGSLSVPAFAMAFAALVVGAGLSPWAAAGAAWVAAVLATSLPAALFLRWRQRVAEAAAVGGDGGGAQAGGSEGRAAGEERGREAAGAGGLAVIEEEDEDVSEAAAILRQPKPQQQLQLQQLQEGQEASP